MKLVKSPLLFWAVLPMMVCSCRDRANVSDAVADSHVAGDEPKPLVGRGNTGVSRASLADLLEMRKNGPEKFPDAFTSFIPIASDEELALLHESLDDSGRYDFTDLMIAHDASRAFEFALKCLKGGSAVTMGIQAFEAIAKESPAEALEKFWKLDPSELRELAFPAFFAGAGESRWQAHKSELIARSQELYPEEQVMLGRALGQTELSGEMLHGELLRAPLPTRKAFTETLASHWVKQQKGTLESLTAQLPEDLRETATDSYFEELSTSAPQEALAMAERMERSDISSAARRWAMKDPAAAVEYFAARPEFKDGLSHVFDHWARVEPHEASEYASTRLTGRAAELAAVEIVQECLKHGDKAGAEKWLETISDPVLQKLAVPR